MNIAVVEDDRLWRGQLGEFLEKFSQEEGEPMAVRSYQNGLDFIEDYQGQFDIVLLDIEMPHMSGMETAREIRKADKNVCLIFITNMAQYAVEGYEVNIRDYLTKPVKYEVFRQRFRLAVDYYKTYHPQQTITLTGAGGFQKLATSEIYYIEVRAHSLIYHTPHGTYTELRRTMKEREEELGPQQFSRCNNYALVNLRYVTALKNGDLTLSDGTTLQISRSRRKQFMFQLAAYMGNTL